MEPFEQSAPNPAAGMMVQGAICIVGGATVLGLGGANVFPNMDQLATLSALWSEAGSSMNGAAVSMLYVAIGMSAVVLLLGLVGVASNFRKNRKMAALALGGVALASALELAGGALFYSLINNSFNILEPSAVVDSPAYSTDEAALLETAHAVFNVCCEAVWSVSTDSAITASNVVPGNPPKDLRNDFQQEILSCDVPENPLPTIIDSVESFASTITKVLRTCYDDAVYNPVAAYLTANSDVCTELNAVNVAVGNDLIIPTTSASINFVLKQSVVALIPPDYVIPDFSMTGFPAFADANGEPGFNCGLMYAKGVAWIQNIFLEDVGFAVSVAIMGAASLQLLSALLTVVLWYMGSNESQDQWMDYEGKPGQTAPYNPKL